MFFVSKDEYQQSAGELDQAFFFSLSLSLVRQVNKHRIRMGRLKQTFLFPST